MSEYHWSNLCKDIIYTKVFKVNQIHYKFFLQNRKTVCICIAFGLKIMKGVSVSVSRASTLSAAACICIVLLFSNDAETSAFPAAEAESHWTEDRNDIQSLVDELQSDQNVATALAPKFDSWFFTPPHPPHESISCYEQFIVELS